MFEAVSSPYLVPFDGSFRQAKARTSPPADAPSEDRCQAGLRKLVQELDDLQQIFFAHDDHALLLVFQALDAAGKDGTIRAVLSGVNPAGLIE